ncbi:MAG: ComEC/Rec2 family competence protein [Bacteroidales bacterium]|nr:ComEC/Rec2 family competence protein [Bacteroidales bacterium]
MHKTGLYKVRLINEPSKKTKVYQCEVQIINTGLQEREALGQKAVLYIARDRKSSLLEVGDCLILYAEMKRAPLYRQKQSFAATGFVRKNNWVKTEKENISLSMNALLFRKLLMQKMKEVIPDANYFSIASALFFGFKQDMDKSLRASFSNIGAGHVLAVSGLHFSILFGMIYFFISFIGNSFRGRILQYMILFPLIWGFALLVNLSPSVIRAAIMITLFGIGRLFFLKLFSLNTLAFTAFFMMLFSPLYLYDIGFQLSFSAVLFILILNPYLNKLYESKNKIIQYVWNLTTISLSAQIGVLPLSVYYFNQFPLLFLFTNICIIPLVTILLFLIPVTLSSYAIFGKVSILWISLNEVLKYMFYCISFLDRLPFRSIASLSLSKIDVFFLYIIATLICFILIRKKVVYLYILLIIGLYRLIYYLC